MARFKFEDVKKSFKNRGDTLASLRYLNCDTKLDYICRNGHPHSITYTNYQQGRGCPECAGNKRKTIEDIRLAFATNGDRLITTEYTNNEQILKYSCKNGHKKSKSWSDYQAGAECFDCMGKRLVTIQDVRDEFAKNGAELLSTEYINSTQRLNYICKKGHESSATWSSYKRGVGCIDCGGKKKKTIQDLKLEFAKNGDNLLSTKYKNSFEKLDYICKKGHHHSITWASYQSGSRCLVCMETGFDPLTPCLFYYIRFDFGEKSYYKVGITRLTVRKRFKKAKIKPVVIYQQLFEQGKEAFEKEQKILQRFSEYRLSKKNFPSSLNFLGKSRGHTELFDFDILNLDKDYSIAQDCHQSCAILKLTPLSI